MGALDWLLGESKNEGKTERKAAGQKQDAPEFKPTQRILAKPFYIITSFTPLRLTARKSNFVNLNVTVKNVTDDPQLVSVDVLLPKNAYMGFEPSCINKAYEKRVGELKPGDTVTAAIPIWAGTQTGAGEYEVGYTVFAHYIGYDKVLNYQKNKTRVRVV
ncbi:MAG: hypothetical protein V1492_06355 [Candidatus Micrarchaeota archaeon]